MTTLKFNPTATAVQFDGNNMEEIQSVIGDAGLSGSPKIEQGQYAVIFMGSVTVLDEQQYRSALGLV